MLNNSDIIEAFPALRRQIQSKKPVVYLDNAATTQKVMSVIEAMDNYNKAGCANIHRGAYAWSVNSTKLYDRSRRIVKDFINSEFEEEIIFTKGATESINLLASTYGEENIKEGDAIVVSILEHHANFVPWQQLAKRKKADLRIIPIDQEGRLVESEYKKMITSDVKLVAITMMSNALGIRPPYEELIDLAHRNGALVLLDAAQAIAHTRIDVRALDVDFLVFSGHKAYGPTGVGVLYGKKTLLDSMRPYQFGGDMIEYVSIEETSFAPLPNKFEAGTPNIDGAIGLGEALNYISKVGYQRIGEIEGRLTDYALNKMNKMDELVLYGPKTYSKEKGPVISFNVRDVHSHDTASILDAYGIAIRSGHHCTQPLMKALSIPSTARISFAIYNTIEEIDTFLEAVREVRRWLGYES